MRTILFFLSVAATIVLVPVASTAQGPTDIEAWRSAKWGMTEAEILEIFKGEARKLDKEVRFSSGTATVEIPDYSIDGTRYRVLFLFDVSTKTLTKIQIQPKRETAASGALNAVLYRRLEMLLTEKYGPPTSAHENKPRNGPAGFDDWVAWWSFPKTIISLHYFDGRLLLIYEPRSKEADKL
ncbi:MAG: hypothetical protein ACHQ7N_00245 [Candidatus Methylomirabilales bacterium]